MKGVLDWISVVARLQAADVPLRATWLGDGSQMVAARALAHNGGVTNKITFMGHVEDKDMVMSVLRAAHVLMFCHKTPESPRILIEALIAVTPIVGYESPYPADLIAGNGGGILTARDDVDALAHAILDLAADRGRLSDLIGRAWRCLPLH